MSNFSYISSEANAVHAKCQSLFNEGKTVPPKALGNIRKNPNVPRKLLEAIEEEQERLSNPEKNWAFSSGSAVAETVVKPDSTKPRNRFKTYSWLMEDSAYLAINEATQRVRLTKVGSQGSSVTFSNPEAMIQLADILKAQAARIEEFNRGNSETLPSIADVLA